MQYHIDNDRLVVNGKPVRFVQTKHVNGRIEPTLIVLHDTAGGPPGNSVGWLTTDPKNTGKASAHVIVERDGTIIQLADFDRGTNHAGNSVWRGRKGCNGYAIGIEIVNPGALFGTPKKASAPFGKSWAEADGVVACPKDAFHGAGCWLRYTDEQLAAVEGLITALAKAYPTITEVAGHYDICVPKGRKVDPTPLMDWPRMRRALGTRKPAPNVDLVKQAQGALVKLGYHLGSVDGNMGPRTRAALRTFQEQNSLPITGEVTADTFDLLANAEKLGAKEMPTGSREEAVQAGAGGKDWDTFVARWGLKAEGGYEVGKGVADLADHVAKAGDAVKVVEEGKGVLGRVFALLEPVATWAITPRGGATILTVIVCAAGWYIAHRIERKRKEQRRTGALMEA